MWLWLVHLSEKLSREVRALVIAACCWVRRCLWAVLAGCREFAPLLDETDGQRGRILAVRDNAVFGSIGIAPGLLAPVCVCVCVS